MLEREVKEPTPLAVILKWLVAGTLFGAGVTASVFSTLGRGGSSTPRVVAGDGNVIVTEPLPAGSGAIAIGAGASVTCIPCAPCAPCPPACGIDNVCFGASCGSAQR